MFYKEVFHVDFPLLHVIHMLSFHMEEDLEQANRLERMQHL
jgi:hypothetical protein